MTESRGPVAWYLAIDSNRVYPLPGGDIDLETAAFAEPLACCLHSMEQAQIEFGEDVVVVGGGIMGQLHNVLAKLRGARTILAEPDSNHREMARRRGANEVIDPTACDPIEKMVHLTNGHGARVCFFTVNALPLAQEYLNALASRGRMIYYGSFHLAGSIRVDPNRIHYGEKRITGSYSPTAKGFWAVSHLLGCRLVDVAPFISERYPMGECQKAFERASSPETYRVLLDLSED